MFCARQGDVLIVEVPAIPKDLKSRKDQKTILAFGEVSGHHHRFEGGNVTAFYKEGDLGQPISGATALRGTRTDVEYISVAPATTRKVPVYGMQPTSQTYEDGSPIMERVQIGEADFAGADLIHEEHDTVNVPPGSYRIVRQREYDMMQGVRRVAD